MLAGSRFHSCGEETEKISATRTFFPISREPGAGPGKMTGSVFCCVLTVVFYR